MALSREGLHRLLWAAAGGPHASVCVEQVRLCEELMVSAPTLNRALKAMEAEGRIAQVSDAGGPTPRTYTVVDPVEWAVGRGIPASAVPGRRRRGGMLGTHGTAPV